MRGGNPFQGGRGGGFGGDFAGLTGPVPRDLWILLGVVFGTFTLQFFRATAWLPELLRLTPLVWRTGFLWQLATYPFIGMGAPNFWFVLELLILFLFGRSVLSRLGSRGFWRLLLSSTVVAGVVAAVVGLLADWMTGPGPPPATTLVLMQGQRMVLTILIAAFATMNQNATILLFFVLPIQARWFLFLEILFAFLGFLATHDLAGFIGLCVAVGFTYGALTGWRSQNFLRRGRLHLQQQWLRFKLKWMRKKRGIHVVRDDDDPRGPWLH